MRNEFYLQSSIIVSKSKTILVTGANGQVGMELRALEAEYPQLNFLFATRDDLPIENLAAVQNYFQQHTINYCINCAAYTAVDRAETETALAFAINETGAENLAVATKQHNCGFIHISTDYVFAGTGNVAYNETDLTEPINVYAASKFAGEKAVAAANEDAIIIRTSWVYSSYGKNFVKTMMNLLRSRESISVVADQYGSPTYAADLAVAMLHIIEVGKSVPGIYHYCNEGIISWYEFAVEIGKLTSANCEVKPIATSEYPTPARRPGFSALNTTKIKEIFGLAISGWQESLERCIKIGDLSNQ